MTLSPQPVAAERELVGDESAKTRHLLHVRRTQRGDATGVSSIRLTRKTLVAATICVCDSIHPRIGRSLRGGFLAQAGRSIHRGLRRPYLRGPPFGDLLATAQQVDHAEALGSPAAGRPSLFGAVSMLPPDQCHRAHVVSVDPRFAEGVFIIWPASDPGGYPLLVDGRAELSSGTTKITPIRAVLHRLAAPATKQSAPRCLHDCVLSRTGLRSGRHFEISAPNGQL